MTKGTKDKLVWFAVGWASVLILKYGVIGITAWNNYLHPGLIPAPNQQSYLQPLLGLVPSLYQTPVQS